MKNEPLDMKLYNEIKDKVWKMYDEPSAYRSGVLVKLYKEAGGEFTGQKNNKHTVESLVSRTMVKRQRNHKLSS